MSKSAIANFFTRQAQVATREKAWIKRLVKELECPTIVEEDKTLFQKEVNEIDFLLKRNWFVDEESIHDVLWDVDEDVFQEIIPRIGTYPFAVQQVLFGYLPMNEKIRVQLKQKIRDLTDENMEIAELQRDDARRKEIQQAWEKHKTENNLQPPVGSLDTEYDDLYANLQRLQKNLEDAKKKSVSGRYVPPTKRDSVSSSNPEVIAVEKKIQLLENELELQKQRIAQENNDWFLRKRCEFERQMLMV